MKLLLGSVIYLFSKLHRHLTNHLTFSTIKFFFSSSLTATDNKKNIASPVQLIDANTLFNDTVIASQILLTPDPYECTFQKIDWLPSFIASNFREIYCTSLYNDAFSLTLFPRCSNGHPKFLWIFPSHGLSK